MFPCCASSRLDQCPAEVQVGPETVSTAGHKMSQCRPLFCINSLFTRTSGDLQGCKLLYPFSSLFVIPLVPNWDITQPATTHNLCECEALAYLRLRHLGQYFMEPSDYFDAPTYKILRFIRSAGRGSIIDHYRSQCKDRECPPLVHSFIHSPLLSSSSLLA
jgi:hypothetical protein